MPTTTPVTVKQTAPKWSLTLLDLAKAVGAAVLTPVLPIVTQTLENGSLTFPIKSIEIAAISGFVVFLGHKLLTPSQTIITGTTPGGTVTVNPPATGTTTAATQVKQN